MVLAKVAREPTHISEFVVSEIVRITGITNVDPCYGETIAEEIASWIDLHFFSDFLQYVPRPARWTRAKKQELERLRTTLQIARSELTSLSHDTLGFLAGATYTECPLRVRNRESIEVVNSFEVALVELVHSVKACLSADQARPEGEFNPRYDDALGPFYSFAELLMGLIVSRGGRATVDKNCRSGTVITALDLLRPYLPRKGLPDFLTTDGAVGGLHRLDKVRASVVRSLRSAQSLDRNRV